MKKRISKKNLIIFSVMIILSITPIVIAAPNYKPLHNTQPMAPSFITFLVKIVLVFAAAIVPITLGDKLAQSIGKKIGNMSKNTKKRQFARTRLGSALQSRSKEKEALAQQRALGRYGRGNFLTRGMAERGRQMLDQNPDSRLGRMLIQPHMNRQVGVLREADRKEMGQYSTRQLEAISANSGNLTEQKSSIYELARRGDFSLASAADRQRWGRFNPIIAENILRGDSPMFKQLKESNPEMIYGAYHALNTNQNGVADRLRANGIDVNQGMAQLRNQAIASIRGANVKKANSWASGTLAGYAYLDHATGEDILRQHLSYQTVKALAGSNIANNKIRGQLSHFDPVTGAPAARTTIYLANGQVNRYGVYEAMSDYGRRGLDEVNAEEYSSISQDRPHPPQGPGGGQNPPPTGGGGNVIQFPQGGRGGQGRGGAAAA